MTEATPHTAFTPAKEVQDIDRFAGRSKELGDLTTALQSEGAQLVIYGQRGIGKSSIARILARLAINDAEVLKRLPNQPFVKFDYFPVFVSCDDSVSSIEKLLVRIMTDEGALADYLPFRVVEQKLNGEVGAKFGIKVVELSGKVSGSITERVTEVDADIFTTFINACRAIVKSGIAKHGILIIVDEFDRIKDNKGLASLLKSVGPEGITFALVGVANTIQELIFEHESVARQLADGAVHIEPMSEIELKEIISRAMGLLEDKYGFAESATNWIISIAKGHPFYVHLVGKHALLHSLRKGESEVSLDTAKEALADIALKGSAPIQETLYKTAIGHSYIREVVLKRFASVDQEEIHTTELYVAISKELNIDSSAVSVYVGQLVTDKYGASIVKTRDRYYRFKDSLFKAYAAARPFQLKPNDREEDA